MGVFDGKSPLNTGQSRPRRITAYNRAALLSSIPRVDNQAILKEVF